MKITNFVKKIINFDMKKEKKIDFGGHPIGNLLQRRAGLRRPTASGLNRGQKHT